jgi:hypothetical protein
MERMTVGPRQMAMKRSKSHALPAAGLLCAVLVGCGTAAAAAAPAASARAGAPSAPAEVGCASVNQATTVTVQRIALIAEPPGEGRKTITQHKATLVRALFGDFCAAVEHPAFPQPALACPVQFGIFYTGTFRDGQRVLATFTYAISGCPSVKVTAAGKTQSTFLLGRAAAAAPHLKSDFAAVLGQPQSKIY